MEEGVVRYRVTISRALSEALTVEAAAAGLDISSYVIHYVVPGKPCAVIDGTALRELMRQAVRVSRSCGVFARALNTNPGADAGLVGRVVAAHNRLQDALIALRSRA